MQIIKSYKDTGQLRLVQRLRLYHLDRPKLRLIRRHRHRRNEFPFDTLDRWVIGLANDSGRSITAVDFAGWYLKTKNLQVTCLESTDLARFYHADCHVEPDIMTWRPTYINHEDIVVFRHPWFLRYASLKDFVDFLKTWVKSTTVLELDIIRIQHNHLKHRLIDLVRSQVDLQIRPWSDSVWIINP